MAPCKGKDPKAVVCFVLDTIFLTAVIFLFALGGTSFSKEHPKVLNYANSMCRVDSRSYKVYRCTGDYFVPYTCYGSAWDVHYGENQTIFAIVESEMRSTSSSDALKEAYKYEINVSYSCWYDTRDPAVAQWEKPDTRVAIILLACGGLSVLLTAICFFITIRRIKQQRLQNRQINNDPYSYSNPYIKQ